MGRYDYVHMRLVVCIVEDKDPRPIIRSLRKMLKPGGWLQWDELDTVNTCVTKVNPGLQTPALEQLRVWSWAEGRRDWTVQLGNFCAEEGFEEVKVDFVGDKDEMARAFNDQHLLTAEEFAEGLVKLGKKEAAAKYFRLVQEAYDESVAGAALCVPRIVCVAQKPL